MKRLLLVLALLASIPALAQQKAPPAAAPVAEVPAYPFPLAERDQIRDLQHEHDQLEIDTQKMLVKIEQNKSRQAADVDAMKLIAFRFAESKKINLDLYELDPAQVSFIRKKKP
jgi:hypothetical protein